MTGVNALGERLAQGFDGVAQMQGSEWWRDLERTLSNPIDGVAPRAIGQRESLAALLGRRRGERRRYQHQRDERLAQGKSQHCGTTFSNCGYGTLIGRPSRSRVSCRPPGSKQKRLPRGSARGPQRRPEWIAAA